MAEARAAFGGVDVLVNNAGVGLLGKVEELTPELLREVFEINVIAPVRCIRAAMPELRARKGVVVNVSSVVGKRALPDIGGYCASKYALEALSESLRAEVASSGVAVVVVCPGRTATEFRSHRLRATGGPNEDVSAIDAMGAERVAEAMVAAVRRRQREVVLTLPGRAMAALERVAPGLMDIVAARIAGRAPEGGNAP
jgi:short-subunit dehydrogenase